MPVAFSDLEILARILLCEAGGEGDDGMRAVASVIVNRTNIPYGGFFRVSQGGNIRNIIEQEGQFTCLKTSVGGRYNPQNVYNIVPEPVHYEIADWALAGNTLSAVGNSLFFFNPYSSVCPQYFPYNGTGILYTKINNHCFYAPTEKYAET